MYLNLYAFSVDFMWQFFFVELAHGTHKSMFSFIRERGFFYERKLPHVVHVDNFDVGLQFWGHDDLSKQ